MNQLGMRNLPSIFSTTIFVLLTGSFLATPVHAELTTQPSTKAVAVDGALPSDPSDIMGQFPNGLHYVIRKNANPPGKVFLDLAVRSGSQNETPEQNGLAHFLEHMAFKGSTHYAPTRLIPTLTHLGMRFGADTNAHTNSFETVFKLTMPDNKPETTDLALTIFSDYANGLSLFPIQIESERRVILEEMRSRDSVAMRERKQEYELLFPGSQMAVHDTLGDPQIIKTAPRDLFVDYWNKWYRPEKMTLVVVGDVETARIIEQAKPLLGTFTARVPAVAAVGAGVKAFDDNKVVILSDPGQVTADVEVLNLQSPRGNISTLGTFRQRMVETIAETIVNRRLQSIINTGRAPFQSARLSSGDLMHSAFLSSARASGEPKDWQKILAMLIYEVNQAGTNGFSQREWESARDSLLAATQQAIQTESTRDSADVIVSLVSSIDTDQPVLSAQQRYDLMKTIMEDVTLEDLHTALRQNFKAQRYAYVLRLPAPKEGEELPSDEDVLAAAKSDWALKLRSAASRSSTQPMTAAATQPEMLLSEEPKPGTIQSRKIDSDLGVTNVVFDNGVILHHLFTAAKKDQVLIEVKLPGGALEENQSNRGISEAAGLLLNRPATHRLSSAAIRRIIGDHHVSMRGGIALDSLSIGLNATPEDMKLGMQLINAVLTDGVLERQPLDQWQKLSLQALRAKPGLAEPLLGDALTDTVFGGDLRFAALSEEAIEAQRQTTAQRWYKHIADHSAIEVTVVGDIKADDAVAMVATYLGSLPKRSGTFEDLDSLRHITRLKGPYVRTLHYKTAEPKALVMAGFIGCDEENPDRRPLALASLILTDRMVQQIRFDQQLVYSIRCSSSTGSLIPGSGLFTASAPTDPKNADRLADVILSIMKDFAGKGPTEDELATAKKQIANQYSGQLQDPRYWLGQLSVLQYHHHSLESLKQVPAVYQTFTTTQVRDALKKYVIDDRLIRIEVMPENDAATAPATQPVTPGDTGLLH